MNIVEQLRPFLLVQNRTRKPEKSQHCFYGWILRDNMLPELEHRGPLQLLLNYYYEDDFNWHNPSQDELKQIKWIKPRDQYHDGCTRSFSQDQQYFKLETTLGVTFYYLKTGGNMTKKQINAKKKLVRTAISQQINQIQELLQS
jgi:hypothetical protein